MSTAALVPVFRYADVPPADREWLRAKADDIRSHAYRAVCDYVRIGQALAEARARLRKKRRFRAWVESDLPFGRAYAYKLIKVAAAFGPHVKPDSPTTIAPEALVVLAAAPADVVAYAVEQAADGHRITARDAKHLVVDYHRRGTPTPGESARHRAAVAACDAEERRLLLETVKDSERAVLAVERLGRLARAGAVVTVAAVVDDDDADGDPPPFHVTALLPGGTRAATRRALADALAAVLGEEATRYCPGCKADKLFGEFGENRLKPGGLESRCKVCERARHRDRKRRLKAAKLLKGPP